MQKNVLKESINKLGIYTGDVIKISNEFGIDYYQYNGMDFIYLCATEEDAVMSEDEVYDLIAGKVGFQILARGNRLLDIKEDIEDIKNIYKHTHKTVTNLNLTFNEYIKTQKEKEEKQKKANFISGCICWGVIVLLAFLSALIC